MERLEKDNEAREKRIQDDRKALLDLEKQRTDIFIGQSKDREASALKEVDKIRTEMGTLRDSLKEDFDDERERFDKEIELRRDHLNKEHELRLELLKQKEESVASGSGEQIFKSAEKIVQELGKHVNSVLEYKKTELAATHSAGNVTEVPERRTNPTATDQVAQPEESESMEDKVRGFLSDPSVKTIIDEWARQVEAKAKPGSFINLFLESVRDPEDYRLRKGCNTLIVAMRTRDWKGILEMLKPGLDKETVAIFETDEAEKFFGFFRKCVLTSVDEWWDEIAQVSRYGGSPAEDLPEETAQEPTEGAPTSEVSQEKAETK